ncbi:MAG: hypothetical protein LKF64_13240 [Alcaligenes faecalis]|nr:hypothetical protein [Alcaligenes faecalis]
MEYNNYFTRGFYFSKKRRIDNCLEGWSCLHVGGYVFQFHPKTSFQIAQSSSGESSVVIIGLPVDLEDFSARPEKIANKSSNLLESDGFEKFQRYIAYLGGRFIAIAIKHAENIIVIPDCHATYACYYTEKNGGAFSSHINLLGKVEELNVNETARSVVNSTDYKAPGGKYYPGLMLPYEEALTLLPNCRLENQFQSSIIANKRFYPFIDLELSCSLSKKNLVSRFNYLLYSNIKGIVKDQDFYVSLTGGMDSGVALSSIIKGGLDKKAKAFTYFNATSVQSTAIKDVMAASQRAFSSNIPHKIVDLKPLELGSHFHQMYSMSFRYGARFPSLARAYYEELPHDILSLVSTCSETGTCFYSGRPEKNISVDLLAEKFSNSEIKKNTIVLESFEKYIEYASFKSSLLGPLDFYDVFYWEHRNAKWASLWYSESDLSHFTVVPFNQRGIIETMLSLPFEDRLNKYILQESLVNF